MSIRRGEIYYITFPYTFDSKFPNGKKKFVVVLQEGEEFSDRNTVAVLLTTSDPTEKDYDMSVTIEKGTTKLDRVKRISCARSPIQLRRNFLSKKVFGVQDILHHLYWMK